MPRREVRFGDEPPTTREGLGSGSPLGGKSNMGKQLDLQSMREGMPQPDGQAKELSPELLKGLEAVKQAQEEQAQAPKEQPSESQNEVPGKEDIPKPEEEALPPVSPIAGITDAARIEQDKKRKVIEERLEDLNFEDLMTNNEVKQKVEIIPKKLMVEFRSQSTEEDLYVKDRLYTETQAQGDVSTTYYVELYAVFNLVIGLTRVNDIKLPGILDDNGKIDKAKFDTKYDMIIKYPATLLGELSTNYQWFLERVADLFDAEKIKNG